MTWIEKARAKKAVKKLGVLVGFYNDSGMDISKEQESLKNAEELVKEDYKEAEKVAFEAYQKICRKAGVAHSALVKCLEQRDELESGLKKIEESGEFALSEYSKRKDLQKKYSLEQIECLKKELESTEKRYELAIFDLEMKVFQSSVATSQHKGEEKEFWGLVLNRTNKILASSKFTKPLPETLYL